MDAVEYLKTVRRLCNEYTPICPDCPAFYVCGDRIYYATQEKMAEALNDVEAWKEEHPAKTRQSELLKLIPNAKMIKGAINVFPCLIDPLYDENHMGECGGRDCDLCRSEYWTEDIE